VVLGADIRTGVDFEAFGRGDYRSASHALRDEWSFWRRTAKAFGFGRTELMPVRSTHEGIGRYVGKYISKHHAARKPEDKGIRLVEYSRGARMARTRFAWSSENAATWRAKVRTFAQVVNTWIEPEATLRGLPLIGDDDIAGLTLWLGPHWAYDMREFIFSLPASSLGPDHLMRVDGAALDTRTGEVLGIAPAQSRTAPNSQPARPAREPGPVAVAARMRAPASLVQLPPPIYESP
jgi:hypothetical protein